MQSSWQTTFLIRRVSPYGLALISTLIFLIAFFFPPSIYSYYMDEPSYMFMDFGALAFFLLCAGSFICGVWLIGIVFPVQAFADDKLESTFSPTAFLLAPLTLGLTLSLLSNFIIVKNNPSLLFLLFAQGGAELKSEIQLGGSFNLTHTFLIGLVWWVSWRCDDLNIEGVSRFWIKVVQYVAIASVVLSAMLKLGRGELMPVVAGLVVIYMLRKARKKQVNTAFLLKIGVGSAAAVLGLFLLFSYIRNSIDLSRDLIAYSLASYNRLSALMAGKLHYPYAGHGIYLVSFLGFNNALNSIIPFRDILGWPSFMDYWQSEFAAMAPAGLSDNSIWAGTFGYIFADIGWLAPVFVFFEGLLCGLVWRSIKLGRPLGIVLYPWFAFCILFWFGMNYLFDNKVVVLFLGAMCLYVYEGLFLKRRALVAVPAV